ncbi:translation initiation factor IF-2 N-terminal domain-containing protein [Corynebacterium sp. H113]|uniref:translation initiation factor IF-2 N-terminal domain-containing protein n=1 Tax=Corynebacterium sp. H113 TaxID=3133419 RepID=UPI0030A0289A
MADYSQELVAQARNFNNEEAPHKIRVHAFAKELGITSKKLIAFLADIDVAVKTASSSVDTEQRAKLLAAISGSDVVAGDATEQAADQATAEPEPAAEPEVTAKPTESDNADAEEAGTEETDVAETHAEDVADQIDVVTDTASDADTAVENSLVIMGDHGDDVTEQLVEVVPPVTPPPPNPTFAVPVFMAPKPIVDTPDELDESIDDDGGEFVVKPEQTEDQEESAAESPERQPRPRRRRGRRRGRGAGAPDSAQKSAQTNATDEAESAPDEGTSQTRVTKTRSVGHVEPAEDDVPVIEEPKAVKGSTRLEAQRRRREERKAESRKRHVISEAEFLARRESVERTMVVRERARTDHHGTVTQVGVLEDDILVEHFVTSDTQTTQIGNIYLGRVQNVLPSMEAAFVDIGTDRNAVLYAGDLNWKMFGNAGRSRRIEHALKSGDQVLVQVTKDPVGHKGARLSTQISLAGRFLVYVPGGRSAGISRKLPESERKRLKEILKEVTPAGSGTIIRTAAENMSREDIKADVDRLEALWQDIDRRSEEAKARRGAKPLTLYEEPDMLVKVVRDLFNEDFTRLVVEGDRPWHTVSDYVERVAPELASRLQQYKAHQHGNVDVFEHFRIDEQLAKALERKVWLPSGGTLVIDRTEAMTVVDVNTGKFTGAGGNLEETVTRNNLEAAEEIVRQMRLRDLGGMIVVDFIDMVLPENQDLVLRRLKEALGRDRTRHEVSEVTSLGLVQMTRKRLGTGLLETFSTCCEACNGRGLIIHVDPVEQDEQPRRHAKSKKNQHKKPTELQKHPVALAMQNDDELEDASRDSTAQGQGADKQSGRQHEERPERQERHDSERPARSGRRRRRVTTRPQDAQDRRTSTQSQETEKPQDAVEAAVESVVAESQAEEKRPPRRRRRRAAAQQGRHRDARREEFREPREDNSIAAVAAAAVAEAREADPEEPSDDRYVAHTGRRRRRRRVVHVDHRAETQRTEPQATAVAEPAPTATQLEAPATPTDKVAKSKTKSEETPERTGKETLAARRRGRRRVVRRVARTDIRQEESPETELLTAADDTNDKQRPETKSGGRSAKRATQRSGQRQAKKQSELRQEKTYEEAKAEFDKSPRRQRPTRGKSRSDHAPKPEDFTPQAEAAAPKTQTAKTDAPQTQAPQAATTGEEASKASAPKSGTASRRGRRRVVRKNTGSQATKKSAPRSSASQPTEAKSGAKTESKKATAPKTGSAQAEPSASSARSGRRRTRRVVRRVSE